MFVKLHFCKMQAQQKSKLNNPAYGGRAFALRHTFSEKNLVSLPQGKTDNLMDYANGNGLFKYQWDLIHDPQRPLFAWSEEMEEGAMMTAVDECWEKGKDNWDKVTPQKYQTKKKLVYNNKSVAISILGI